MTEPVTSQPVTDNEPRAATATDQRLSPKPRPSRRPSRGRRRARVSGTRTTTSMSCWRALLLAFIVSCNYVAGSRLFLHLKAGQLILDQGKPVTTDEFSYTENGRPWIDCALAVPGGDRGPLPDGVQPGAREPGRSNGESGDRRPDGDGNAGWFERPLAAGDSLVALLKIRHAGPGLWWSALCVTAAVGACSIRYRPDDGRAGRAGESDARDLGRAAPGLELLILFRAYSLGKGKWSVAARCRSSCCGRMSTSRS